MQPLLAQMMDWNDAGPTHGWGGAGGMWFLALFVIALVLAVALMARSFSRR